MPYYIEASGGQFCVYKEGVAEPMHCYARASDANAYLAALTIATADEVKAESYTPDRKSTSLNPSPVSEPRRPSSA